jgi:hypothetical protein
MPRNSGAVHPAMSALRVELFWDDEAGNWHYRVPALHINGGGTPTREAAEYECLSAIASERTCRRLSQDVASRETLRNRK